MKKIYFLCIVISLLFSVDCLSQTGSLSGKIIEKKTNEPVLFGSVTLYQNGIFKRATESDLDGNYTFNELELGVYVIKVSYLGFKTIQIESVEILESETTTANIELEAEEVLLDEIVVKAYKMPLVRKDNSTSSVQIVSENITSKKKRGRRSTVTSSNNRNEYSNTDEYSSKIENAYVKTRKNRFSTFGVDVDRASYSIVRNQLNHGRLPPVDAVRAEEMINYFTYNYTESTNQHPFAVHSEWAVCPWNEEHLLLSVALQGTRSDIQNLPSSNLTFLLDVSGSMASPNKLPLVKSSMRILLDQLQAEDKVSIVVYAGAAGLVLPPTSVANKDRILQALDQLQSGGSTAGGAGIQLAYKTAREQFMQEGNNRIILATDGDFNVGLSSVDELEQLIEKEKDTGIFLTVLGFGMGNLKDNRMERLADKGNGMYSYIDTEQEARKVFETELTSSLFTIAKDVKMQLRFNKREISEYRLIGYENRLLNKEDFNDDTKDAGELGAGHTVTALYEVIPSSTLNKPVKLELRYKRPYGRESFLLEHEVSQFVKPFDDASENLQWAATVASYSMLLTNSSYKGETSFNIIQSWALNALGEDRFGFRRDFVEQIRLTDELRLRFGTAD